MARRGKKKKNKTKKSYNKREFAEVFCQTCLICQKPSPTFCYAFLYKREPKPFINKVFNNLVDICAVYEGLGRSIKSMSIEQFQNVVCKTGACFNGAGGGYAHCGIINSCYTKFMQQQGVKNLGIIREANPDDLIEFDNTKSKNKYISYKKRKKKKRGKRYVCASYPTFFSRDNADFQAEIRKILYGDNDIQQNKDKELPEADTGAADRSTEGGESEVQRSSSEGSVDGKS